jgi:predicted alpha/beta hydrolase family esterase
MGPWDWWGHSLGAAIAVRAAHRLATRVAGVFSIEGNLTQADAYFSGAACRFDDPDLCKEAPDRAGAGSGVLLEAWRTLARA